MSSPPPGPVDSDGDSIIEPAIPPSPPPPPHPIDPSPITAASTSTLPPEEGPQFPSPSGPLCHYGPRLSYTYFPHPAPSQESLNEAEFGLDENGEGVQGAGNVNWFSIDDQLVYLSFYMDSGPLNAACLYRFCLHLHTLLEEPNLRRKKIVLYSSDEPDKKANAATLIALYAMIVMRWTPADVLHPIAGLELQPFRDAGYSLPTFHLSLQSLLFGIHRAVTLTSPPLLDLSVFDLTSYERFEKVEEGDWNWLTKGIIAFASPVEPGWVASRGAVSTSAAVEGGKRLSKSFRNVLDEFEKGGVKVVVRLNKKLYNRQHFLERGIEHIEMYFDDGTNPTMEMTREFIDLADRTISAGGVIAVHCKAGLGRTGTLIGAYLIYKHGFTAAEAIGFMRLMRPGSCVGPQQHYLYENQMTYVRWAAVDAVKAEMAASSTSTASASNNNHITAPRPITPPNEVDLARSRAVTPSTSTANHPTTPGVVPRTPGRPVAVPGQPRKTPGKSKHSVATPEVKFEDEEHLSERKDLMLVTEEEGDTDGAEDAMKDVRPSPPPPHLDLSPVVGAGRGGRVPSSPKKTTRPTRIARARTNTAPTGTRPLSAITDNRIVDRIDEVRRSKAVKAELSSLFDARTPEESQGEGSPTQAQSSGQGVGGSNGRYDLRTSGGPSTLPPPIPTPSSPSRLPQRIPAKRRGKNEATTTSCQMEGLKVNGGGGGASEGIKGVGLGRSVRRRRSSLGETDFVATK